MRLVFLGTPQFAVPTLERIRAAGHQVVCVITQPDRPRGRGQVSAASPVKQAAERLGLPVYQPQRIRRPEAVETIAGLHPEAMVVVGYGQIIPQSVIDLAPLGILNVHASLLPKYRGAAPVQWAVLNGEQETGVTIMQIDAGLDTGDMLRKAATPIGPDETASEVSERLAAMGAELLVETLPELSAGRVIREKQDPSQATYAPLLEKEHGRIDWSQNARSIHNRVRGLQPWPGAWTHFRGQILHIWRSSPDPSTCDVPPGRMLRGAGLAVACGEGSCLQLIEVQLEGRKRMTGADFANGQRLSGSDFLGDAS